MLPTREEALKLICDGLLFNPGPWGKHCLTAAHCAEKIASACGDMDVEKAYILGLLHDIGRKFGVRHRTEGKANTGAKPAVLEGAYPDEKELKAIRKSLNICTVVMGVCTFGIGLLWCIPIRKKILNRIDRREPVSNGLKIAATWVGMIPGLLLLVNEDI